MDKKYYTPEITEFHVGFEFETRGHVINTSWQKITADWQELDIVFDDFEHDENFKSIYRVKYLDKEDIKSLGWVQGKLPYQYFKSTYRLVDLKNNKYSISQPNLYDDTEFRGIIKNKSELIKVMKMLEIDG